MKRMAGRGLSSLRQMLSREEGSVTVEAVLWLPLLLLLLTVVADASLIFGTRAQILRVVQDANRAWSIGSFKDDAKSTANQKAVAFIKANIGGFSDKATVTAVKGEFGVLSSTVTIPSWRLTATGFFSGLAGFNVTVNAKHLSES